MRETGSWILESERIKLMPLAICDAPFIFELLNTPDWIKYIGDRNIKNELDARNYLRTGPLKSYEEHGFGLLKVQLKSTSTPVGLCGLLQRDFLDGPDLGFALLPAYFGKGITYESCQILLASLVKSKKFEKIYAFTNKANVPSRNLLLKIGFIFEKQFNPYSEDEWLDLFSLTL